MAVFNGDAGNNNIFAAVTDDQVNGLDGNDTLNGGSGGVDTLFGGNGDDVLFVASDDEAFGGSGNDIIAVSGEQPGVLDGGAGTGDILRFESSFDITGIALTGFEQLNVFGNASMTAAQLNSFALVSGYNAATTSAQIRLSQGGTAVINLDATLSATFSLTGSDQADLLTFNATHFGNLSISAGRGDDNVSGATGNDTMNGDEGNDTLVGLDGNDVLNGSFGSDALFGGNGFDTLTGGTGDTLNGGADDDLFSITSSFPATISGGGGLDTLRLEGSFDLTNAVLTSVEFLNLTGNVGLTLTQLASFAQVAGYNVATTSAQVFLTEGGTGTVNLAPTLTSSFTLTGSSEADNITFTPAFGATIQVFAGTGDDSITAGAGADSLRGDDGNDTLNGLGGIDTLDGSDGTDQLFGGNSDDVLIVRINDSAFGGTGNDLISINESFASTLDGGIGQDTLRMEGGFDLTGATLLGIEQLNVNGNVQLTATQLDTFVRVAGYAPNFTSGTITLTEGGTADINLLSSLSAGFTLNGSASADILTFDPGYLSLITVNAGSGDDSITSASGADSLRGDNGNDTINGGNGNDSLDGGVGIDALFGGGNNDVIIARIGDSVFGGSGDDLVSVQGNLPAVLDGGFGNDILRFESAFDVSGATITGFEQLNLNGTVLMTTAQLNQFSLVSGYGPGFTSATLTLTQGGTAAVTLDAGLTVSFTLNGSSTGDRITFAPAGVQKVIVNGNDGNDSIFAAGGSDSLNGGNGRDTLRGSNGDDSIDGGQGVDLLDGGNGNDFITVRAGDTAIGGSNDDLISVAENLPANIDGGTGQDTLRLESGFDISTTTLTGIEFLNLNGQVQMTAAQLGSFNTVQGYNSGFTSAQVFLTVGGTANVNLAATLSSGFTLSGSAQDDDISFNVSFLGPISTFSGFGNDDITSAAGNDFLRGEQGNDTLSGLGGNDTLEGGAGADLLIGGLGIDRLTGGSGQDIFQFATATASPGTTPDVIVDFEGAGVGQGDVIDVAGIDADGGLGAQDSFVFGSAGLAGLSLIDVGTDTHVRLNTDNDATFEVIIVIQDGGVLAASYTSDDFLL